MERSANWMVRLKAAGDVKSTLGVSEFHVVKTLQEKILQKHYRLCQVTLCIPYVNCRSGDCCMLRTAAVSAIDLFATYSC